MYHHNPASPCQLHPVDYFPDSFQDPTGPDPVTLQLRGFSFGPLWGIDLHQVLRFEVNPSCMQVIGSLLAGPCSLSLSPRKLMCLLQPLS